MYYIEFKINNKIKMLTVSFDIGIVNLAVCVLQDDKVIIWKVISLFEKKPNYIPISKISESVYINMDALIGDIAYALKKSHTEIYIDNVLLENQPQRINGTMKSVQMLLFGYFYNLKHYDGIVNKVHQVNASLKLKGHDILKSAYCSNKSQRYKNNKKDGIVICSSYISSCKFLSNLLACHKKKDDLCDSFLQAVSWLREYKKTTIKKFYIFDKTYQQ